ncbi:snf2 family [Lasius niger]|uniref:Snf2 family n=1 Tax=Lasius niger TaxID=67767 RepID=A0A0J7KN16_LASNI|nr:snf2 family [Lasius niger]
MAALRLLSGLAKAKEEAIRLDTEAVHVKAERELLDNWTEVRKIRSMRLLLGEPVDPAGKDGEEEEGRCLSDLTAGEIQARILSWWKPRRRYGRSPLLRRGTKVPL